MTAESVIRLNDVNFSYDGPPVLEKVTLSIAERDLVCVIGPNGGGKSTLLKIMLGLIEPSSGTVEVCGQVPAKTRKQIGYMPQYAHLDPRFPVTVFDVVLMGRLGRARSWGPYPWADKAAALDALEEVGLADMKSRPLSALSGGQRQRVLIARALACAPRILLLDEPMASLDPKVQDDLHHLLRKLNERLTVVMVSHDLGFVSLFFRTVVCVNHKVHTHPCQELTEKQVADMYGRAVRLLHHTRGGEAGGRS
ncbi:MAG: ABC transporter ATP-binding protein [Phycisphaerales bacterium]|nr:ABC transporter ATP-binding protein [Phycisphaerales bacterium]